MNTREKILKTAVELFSKNGYEGTCMEEIARRVGIRKASLYSHFSGKREIFETIFKNIIEEYRSFIENLCKNNDKLTIKQRLKKIFKEHVLYNKRDIRMSFWDRFYYFPPEEFKEYIYKITLETGIEFSERLKKIFLEGIKRREIKNNNPDSIVATYLYALNGLSLSVGLYNEEKLEIEINKAIDVFLKII